ncbi:MAG: phosphatidylglycerol lysyltransferase domain-containing protein [candidate division WOR-3 bacterium]|nr:phosphatidylglycerol lysyltransferase domain-containing protein [candidate division WOR-3 bacterium]
MDDGRGKTRSSTFTSTSASTFSSALEKYRCEYRQINAGNVPDCLALETSWCNLRHCDMDPGLAAEQRAIAACFENWEQFSLIGGAVVVEGRIEAFAIGERLNSTTAVVHFEKANPELRGMYQLINQWFSRNELSEYAYVNREQDPGIEGLRKAKESYHPRHMVRKFTVRP